MSQSMESHPMVTSAQTMPTSLSTNVDEPMDDLEVMKERLKTMEEEAEMLGRLQEEFKHQIQHASSESQEDIDARSVFVGKVEYKATPEQVKEHFQSSGTINRVTILCDKRTGMPKGYAYIEFANKESVENALHLHGSMLLGREIEVVAKRTNVPRFKMMGGRGRGRGGMRGGFVPYRGGRGSGFRGGFRGVRRPYRPY